MEFMEMTRMALIVRRRYDARDRAKFGRTWTSEEVALGLMGDVGDLAKLVQGKAGVRPRADLDAAVAHELADCLWSLIVLADDYGVDLECAFARTMSELSTSLPHPT